MIILVTIVHVIVCLFLIIVVLLQSGKAGDISAAFRWPGQPGGLWPAWRSHSSFQGHHNLCRALHVDLSNAFH